MMRSRMLAVVTLLTGGLLGYGFVPSYGQEIGSSATVEGKFGHELIVFDFYAPGSADCAAIKQTVSKAEQRYYGRVEIIHVNIDRPTNKAFVEKVGVESVPALLVFNKDGDQMKKLVGSEEGRVLPILLETLLPDAGQDGYQMLESDNGPCLPVRLVKQEASLDVQKASL